MKTLKTLAVGASLLIGTSAIYAQDACQKTLEINYKLKGETVEQTISKTVDCDTKIDEDAILKENGVDKSKLATIDISVKVKKEGNASDFNDFEFDGDDASSVKVIKTDDGKKIIKVISKNGDESSFDGANMKVMMLGDDQTMDLKSGDGNKVMIFKSNGDHNGSMDDAEIQKLLKEKGINLENLEGEDGAMMKIMKMCDDKNPQVKFISTDGNTQIIKGNDFEWSEDDMDGKKHVIIKRNGDGSNMTNEEIQKLLNEAHIDIDIEELSDGKKIVSKMVMIHIELDDVEPALIEEINNKNANANLKVDGGLNLDNLKFYPNPTTGQFNLSFDANTKADTEISVFDINGNQVYNEVKPEINGMYNNAIDLSGNAKGTYLLNINQGGKSVVKKVVVQ